MCDHVPAGRALILTGATRRRVHRLGAPPQDSALPATMPRRGQRGRARMWSPRHLRHVGEDCLVAFDSNLYSVPAHKDCHRQLMEIRASAARVTLHATVPDRGHHKSLDDYGFSFQPDLDPRKFRDLATLAFAETKTNVALLDPLGVGKTHIAVALAERQAGLASRSASPRRT